ncbi:kazal-type serine protease inhibitor domain-containing protein 1-like [Acipenser oxyrinchus oxyrinchus]|uniref:Kazal-type serine protease inhibitor domain-containing protein 1-like n=1 Tax=Acipenser oxyrinchus oxyrinchus TaxID=40147 RepID=A0AAD8FSJ7_ACIOX|nr:kazal-type serine protease inhibitor domain-containing protein 1-like [Acipenser oxyrinchus oxyrinchus]
MSRGIHSETAMACDDKICTLYLKHRESRLLATMVYCRLLFLLVCICHGDSFPNPGQGDGFAVVGAEQDDATDCHPCSLELCPVAVDCRAGLVLDRCGCCMECGNIEAQPCDLDSTNSFYGLCGDNLECRMDISVLEHGEVPEPQCVCVSQEAVCGSDGRTYENVCKFKEAAGGQTSVVSTGPCFTVPRIEHPPQDHVNVTGSDIIFLCEVFAFPMAVIEWRKDGDDSSLPGDDPHISVQSRGGPMKYELSSWLQIERVTKGDAGTYRCVARNRLGWITASAVLAVLEEGVASSISPANTTEAVISEHTEDYYDY